MYTISRINSLSCIIPKEELNLLSRSEILVSDILIRLMQCTAKRSPSGAFYAFPSESYLSDRVGYTRSYISEVVCMLQQKGYFDITRRRKVNGRWQTNLYRVGIRLAQFLKCVTSFVSSVFRRVGKNRHIVNKPSISNPELRKKILLKSKSPPFQQEVMDYIHNLGHRLNLSKDTTAT